VISQIHGLEHVFSVSKPGLAIVTAQFKVGVPRTEALVRLQDTINANRDWLPKELGVGVSISPGYAYERAPDQEHFLNRTKTKKLFRDVFALGKGKKWNFMHSGLFLDFLAGNQSYECTPWGMPARNIFGWQKPCYLLGEGYTKTFRELMDTTDWDTYGTGKYEKCADCMAHCGYEPTAANAALERARAIGALHAAAEAAGAQGRFFEMVDSLYADRGRVDDPHLWERVKSLDLDLERFEADRRSDEVTRRVRRDFESGIRAGVTGTPALFPGRAGS